MTLISELEALTVAPDEVLIIRLTAPSPLVDGGDQQLAAITAALEHVGLSGRCLIFANDSGIELSKVKISDELVRQVAAAIPSSRPYRLFGPNTVESPDNEWAGEGTS